VDVWQPITEDQRRELYEAVLAQAHRITRSRSAADDLAHEALLRLMTTRPWDPRGTTSLERHLFGILKSLLWAERISKRSDYEARAGAEEAAVSEAGRSAEQVALDRGEQERHEALAAQRVGRLRAKLAGWELELLLCDLVAEDVKKPAELAARSGRSVAEVNAALSRIRRYMKSILAAERGEDEEVA